MKSLTTRARNWLPNLPRSGQKGFTLIEMLVVISILGILAAVVTMSMVGVTRLAQTHANETELKTVQVAMDTMASQQQLDPSQVCPNPQASPTNDMGQFPVPAPSAAVGSPIQLYPRYLHQQTTSRSYTCDSSGIVHQS
jgi:prepilin-type N-terminal cleavage/methylation domain-containing protein